jgi:hypothetical protein
VDDLGGAEHPDLDGVYADVADDRANLREDDVGGHEMDGGDTERVLGGDRRDRAHAVDPTAGESLQIGLYPRPATRIGAGDGERTRGVGDG